jgi:protein involved in polysaccharide export with SLBB domain
MRFSSLMVLNRVWRLLSLAVLCSALAGCGDGIRSPSPEELAEFEQADAGGPILDLNRLAQARLQTGPYRVVSGDVLQLDMPARLFQEALGAQTIAAGKVSQNCRVDAAGSITLPDGRQIAVRGLPLAEVESAVADAYYPSLVRARPAIYAQVVEYATATVRVMGSVNKPGLYRVRHDQMTVVGVLMEAGEVVDGGAATIRIVRAGSLGADHTPAQATSASPVVRMGAVLDPVGPLPAGLSVRFKKEGPLSTTGALMIDEGGAPLLNQWLDAGNAHQRRAVLSTLNGRLTRDCIDELDARLVRLARLMDSRAAGEPARPAASQAGWTGVQSGVFFASMEGPDPSALPAEKPAGEPKRLVYGGDASAPPTGAGDVTVTLPVRGLNIPFADVPVVDGDSVIVERIKPQTVSVMGLVARPGSFPYPPDVHYTLAEALALAGGLDMVAEPRFVTVYRLRHNGSIASATFEFARNSTQEHLTEALAVRVRPGDVISVEHTPRTRTNVFLDRVIRVSLGVYATPGDF